MMTLLVFAIVGVFACGFVLGGMLAVGAAADGPVAPTEMTRMRPWPWPRWAFMPDEAGWEGERAPKLEL
jgi:hypothetical protein